MLKENKIKLEIEKIVNKFTEENRLNKLGILFEKPKGKDEE